VPVYAQFDYRIEELGMEQKHIFKENLLYVGGISGTCTE
jgi:hypothetical protein